MRAIATVLLVLILGCTSPKKQQGFNFYEQDFKTVFQVSLSALKDSKFTIKSYDWNSGEIEGYKTLDVHGKRKTISSTVSVEQINSKVKVRLSLAGKVNSEPIPQSEFKSIESQFFQSLDNAIKASVLR